jgi:hypothetical protein
LTNKHTLEPPWNIFKKIEAWVVFAHRTVTHVTRYFFLFFLNEVEIFFEMVLNYCWLRKMYMHKVCKKLYLPLKCLEISLAPWIIYIYIYNVNKVIILWILLFEVAIYQPWYLNFWLENACKEMYKTVWKRGANRIPKKI